MSAPAWNWVRVHGTRFYRVWRYWPGAPRDSTEVGKERLILEQCAAVVDDFGNLIFIELEG